MERVEMSRQQRCQDSREVESRDVERVEMWSVRESGCEESKM